MRVNTNKATRSQLGLELAVVVSMATEACRTEGVLPATLYDSVMTDAMFSSFVTNRIVDRLEREVKPNATY